MLVFRCQKLRSHFVHTMFRFMLNKLNAWIRFCHTFLFIFFFVHSLSCLCSVIRAFCSSYFNGMIWSLLEGLHFILWFQCDAWQYVTFSTCSQFLFCCSLFLFTVSPHRIATPNYIFQIQIDAMVNNEVRLSFFHLMNMFQSFDMCYCIWKKPFFAFRENHIKSNRDEEKEKKKHTHTIETSEY